jgi:hypothetical protein
MITKVKAKLIREEFIQNNLEQVGAFRTLSLCIFKPREFGAYLMYYFFLWEGKDL